MKITKKVKRIIYLTLSCIVIVMLVAGFCCYGDHASQLLACLRTIRPGVLLLLLPVVMGMYNAAGMIWHPYLREEDLSANLLARIQYEICFVNTMVPFMDMLSGMQYAKMRLVDLKVPEEKAEGLHVYRYWVTIFTKWVEIAIALIILARIGDSSKSAVLVRELIAGFSALILGGFVLGFIVVWASCKYYPDTLREKKSKTRGLRETFMLVVADRKAFLTSLAWGMLYSLLEVMPYLVVAVSLDRAELFLPILVVSGIGVIFGIMTFTPLGAGTSEAAMALLAWAMGYDLVPVVVILMISRILITIGTGVTGFYVWLPSARELASKKR